MSSLADSIATEDGVQVRGMESTLVGCQPGRNNSGVAEQTMMANAGLSALASFSELLLFWKLPIMPWMIL